MKTLAYLIGGGLVLLLTLGLLFFLIWFFVWRKRSLDTPLGEMVPIAGPFPVENGFTDSGTGVGVTDYCKRQLWGLYGYRAIRFSKGESEPSSTSKVCWMTKRLKVADPAHPAESPGFKFRVPVQSNSLISADIQYELVVSYFEAQAGGSEIVDTVPVGRSPSGTSPVILSETIDSTNRLPTFCRP